VGDVILTSGFVVISTGANLVPEAEFVFLDILVHILDDGGGDVLAEKVQGFFPFPGELIPGAVVAGLFVNQAGFLQFI